MNGRATPASAPNVVSMATNRFACVSATGATSAAVASRAWKNRPSSVLGEPRLRITGCRWESSGRSSPIPWFRSMPLPATALPNSSRLCWIATRVGVSNMFSTWSNSTGDGWACESGRVAPSAKPWVEWPLWISRYLRPSAERVRTMTLESVGSGLTLASSFRSTFAQVAPGVLCPDGLEH